MYGVMYIYVLINLKMIYDDVICILNIKIFDIMMNWIYSYSIFDM